MKIFKNIFKMVKKLATIITVVFLILVNIFLSYFIEKSNYSGYYEEDNMPQNIKKNTITTIIPAKKNVLGNFYQDFLKHNLKEEIDLDNFFYFDMDNNFHINNNYCLSLLQKFIFCLAEENLKNLKNSKCNKLIEKQIEQLDKCQIDFNIDFDTIDYTKNPDKNIVYFNLSNYDNDNDSVGDDELEFDDKLLDIKEMEYIINKNKNENIISFEEKYVNINDNLNKDCIEYGLSKDEVLICTKYE